MRGPDGSDVIRVALATILAAAFLAWWPLAVAQAGAATAQTATVEVIDVDTSGHPEVSVTVDVADEVLDAADAVSVVEAGRTIEAQLHRGGDARQEVALVVDTSGSMIGSPLEAAKSAVAAFVAALPPGIRVTVVGFGTRPYVVVPMTDDVAAAAAAVAGLEADGDTALYDGLALAVAQFSDARVPRSLLLVSDGGDTASTLTLDALTAQLLGGRARLFAVQLVTSESNRAALDQLAQATSGRVVDAGDASALTATYEAVAAATLRQATVTYRSQANGPASLAVSLGRGMTSSAVDVAFPTLVAAPTAEAAPAGPAAASDAAGAAPLAPAVGAAALFVALLILGNLAFRRPQQSLLAQDRRRRRSAEPRRAGVLQAAKQRAGVVVERRMEQRGRRDALGTRLENAGIALRPGEYLVGVAAGSAVAAVLGTAMGGLVLGALFAAGVVVCARAVVRSRTSKRRQSLEDQLSEMLQQLCSSLRAGYGVMQALDAVAREIDAPMSDELRRLVHEVQLGRELAEALEAMGERVGGQDFEWVVQAIEINREVGGDLVEVLEAVATTIRAREHLQRQLKTLSAQGRLSARILLTMPFVMGALLSVLSPGHLSVLFSRGIALVMVGGVLMLTGWLWLRRIVRLQF